MSELLYYLCQRPRYTAGHTPIRVEGNWFLKGDKRFFLKGISYIPRKADHKHAHNRTLVDPLSDDWLPDLRRDIPFFHQLGINTLSVSKYDLTKQHDRALKLLADEGIHIVLTIFNELQAKLKWPPGQPSPDYATMNPASMYTKELVEPLLLTIEQTAHHPNILAYCVSAYAINNHGVKKFSPLVRAAIRDCKHHLYRLSARRIPIGVGVPDMVELQKSSQAFYTAGSPLERADFFSFNCFSWAGESSFTVSGYDHLVRRLQDVPAPMFFSAYGTAITGRGFGEVECLHSRPEMIEVFSGGVVYTYSWHDSDYDLVRVRDDGVTMPTKDYWKLKERLRNVKDSNAGKENQYPKDYENWRGEFPDLSDWKLDTAMVPPFPLGWSAMSASDKDDWELV